jgi:hypothetical protein
MSEYDMFHSLLLLQCFGAWSLQAIGIGTAGMFFLSACPLFLGLLLNRFFLAADGAHSPGSKNRDISLLTYAIGQANSLFGGTLLIIGVLQFFVPLVSPFSSCCLTRQSHLSHLRPAALVLPFLQTISSRRL